MLQLTSTSKEITVHTWVRFNYQIINVLHFRGYWQINVMRCEGILGRSFLFLCFVTSPFRGSNQIFLVFVCIYIIMFLCYLFLYLHHFKVSPNLTFTQRLQSHSQNCKILYNSLLTTKIICAIKFRLSMLFSRKQSIKDTKHQNCQDCTNHHD